MLKKSFSFCCTVLTAIVLSGCVANEPAQLSLAANSLTPSDNTLSDAGYAIFDLPAEGPVPLSRPEILSLSNGASISAVSLYAEPAAKPAELQAMLEPEKTPQIAKPDLSLQAAPTIASNSQRDCLMRAMYFESNRSSPDGLLSVGTVVMHRLENGAWGNTICGVVGAKRQFAPGVLSRKMQGNLNDLQLLADQIIAGKRQPKLAKNVMFFHVAGMKFPYKNMRYVHVAGGNTFYYKAARKRRS